MARVPGFHPGCPGSTPGIRSHFKPLFTVPLRATSQNIILATKQSEKIPSEFLFSVLMSLSV